MLLLGQSSDLSIDILTNTEHVELDGKLFHTNIYFHLKQHMRNVHEEKKTNNFPININDDQKLDEYEFTNKNDMMHQLQRHSNSNEKKQA